MLFPMLKLLLHRTFSSKLINLSINKRVHRVLAHPIDKQLLFRYANLVKEKTLEIIAQSTWHPLTNCLLYSLFNYSKIKFTALDRKR